MKRLLLFALIAWNSLHLPAQVTITSSTFPATGDILRYVQAANPNIAVALFTPPGGNQFWDLSVLTPASTFEVSYRPAAEGSFQDAFPAATMVVFSGTSEYYYTSSGTKFELLGHVDNTIGGLPIVAIYKNQPIIAERRAPLNFFDIFQQTSNNTLQWSYGEIPAGVLILPITPDSLRLRINRQILDVVDGYGTLRLPGALPQSEFPVLRLKKTAYITQNIELKIPPLGWIDVSQAAPGSGSPWASLLGTDTITTLHYLNDITKEEIAVLTFNNALNGVLSVVYKNTSPSTPVVEAPGGALSRLEVYPNPAVSTVTISCTDAPSGVYTLKIFSSLGTITKESKHLFIENTRIQVVLPIGVNGLYFCRLEDENGRVMGVSRLMVVDSR